jgi:hypothetical protein
VDGISHDDSCSAATEDEDYVQQQQQQRMERTDSRDALTIKQEQTSADI